MGTVILDIDTVEGSRAAAPNAQGAYRLFDKNSLTGFWRAIVDMEREVAKNGWERIVAIDTETTGLSPTKDSLVLIQIHHERCTPIILDARGTERAKVKAVLKLLLESGDWLKVAHNMYFDAAFLLAKYNLNIDRLFCTKIAENLLTAGLGEDARLDTVAEKYLGVEMNKELRAEFTTVGNDIIRPELLEYAARDVALLPKLTRILSRKLAEQDLLKVARLEFAALPAIVKASVHGVRIDQERWRAHVSMLEEEAGTKGVLLEAELQAYIDRWRRERYEATFADYIPALGQYQVAYAYREEQAQAFKARMLKQGMSRGEAQKALNSWKKENPPPKKPPEPRITEGPINMSSPEQLGGALYMMGVPLPVKDSGAYSTDKLTMKRLADEWDICARILEWREYEKMVTSFGEAVLQFVDENVRLHPVYNQLVSTGRMSCSQPNIQQVPDNRIGKEFRRCFVAPEGKKLVAADYSQIELRILAELSGEENMIQAFEGGVDLHSLTASRMFGVPFETVHDEHGENRHMRKAAKAINFGIAYGLSPQGLARNERIPLPDARRYIDAYFDANPVLKDWLERTGEEGLKRMYAVTMLGRKRYFPKIEVTREDDYREWERIRNKYRRMITNHPIQGTSADITKLAIYKLHKALAGTGAVPILFVHDEIVVEVGEDDAEMCAKAMVREMKSAARYFLKRVPVDVSCKISDTWEH